MKLQYLVLLFMYLMVFNHKTANGQKTKNQTSTLIIEYDKDIPIDYLSELKFYPPIGGKFYNALIPSDGTIDNRKKQVYLHFEQLEPCFIAVKYGRKKLVGYIEPGETIIAKLPNENISFSFRGSRSLENNLYNSILPQQEREKLYNNIKQKLNGVSKENMPGPKYAPSWNDTHLSLKEYLEQEWNNIIRRYIDLSNEGKISPVALKHFTTALYTAFYSRTLALLAAVDKNERKNTLNRLSFIFPDKISLNPILTQVPDGNTFLNAYAVYQNDYKDDDVEFKVFDKYYHYRVLTPVQQEYMLGRAFYLEKVTSSFNTSFDTKNAFQTYQRRYLNSVFTPIIGKIHEEAFGDVEIVYRSQHDEHKIDPSTKATQIDFSDNKMVVTTISVNSLHRYLEEYVGGYPAYLDFWATWCTPCIAELDRAHTTKKLMDGEGVKMVYISIDKPENKDKWLNVIKHKKLYGNHLLVSEVLLKELKDTYEVKTIPRYMLSDKDGNFINKDAPRPSSFRKLMEEILYRFKKTS